MHCQDGTSGGCRKDRGQEPFPVGQVATALDPAFVIAKRCALELRDGEVVNRGFGQKPNTRDAVI
jgi:acyl CoA:acetate/3-ketoacid CoA transferase